MGKLYSSALFGIGYNIIENISFDLSITKMLKEEYGKFIYRGIPEDYPIEILDGEYTLKAYWILKSGVNLYF